MRKFTKYAAAAVAAAMLLAGCASGAGAEAASSATETTAAAASEAETAEAEETTGAQSGAESEAEAAPVKSEGIDQVTVTYVQSPLNVPSIVEKDLEIFSKNFADNGVSVAYSNLTTGPEQTQALASGDIQFLNAVGATSVILSASNEADIKIISMYSRSPKAFMLFSKDDSISSAEDLRGKTIGGPKGTILHEVLVAYLNEAGMTESDVNFVNMGIPDAQAALTGGSVDAALLAGPTAYNMQKDGFHVVTTGEGLTDASIVTATSQKFYDEHPELVETFVKSQKEVLDYMDENYDEAVAMAAKATELSEDAVKEMYGMYDFSMDISEEDIAGMEKTEQFMKDTGMIENDVDIRSLILD
ncbi:MAG: NrtA/SsuA/CpmA family ABC transporter substrate-binding protein, partial [Eubacteriales bacterium]|nr:NrtA/SsuA/CpmA family ABC transporter substrate-binding protein [Eubacteriales bacterium]